MIGFTAGFTVAVLLVLPLVVLRRRTLVRYYAVDALTWLFAWLLWRRLPAFDPWLGGTLVAALKVTTFGVFLARGRDLCWSANRAAVVAVLVYAAAIPSMTRFPIDGDEPFYLLVTESLVHDGDLDLANQYQHLERTASGRKDLHPQFGDPTGPHGELYSRHEPFLSLLLIPGYLLGGLYGAIGTIALFGMLLVRSTVRWMEDEGIPDATVRAVFPFFAFGPPVLFYATRIWPEVPAAFFFVEAIRGVRAQRLKRWLPALFGLVMLKLRFLLVAAGLVLAIAVDWWRGRRATRAASRRGLLMAVAALVVIAIPLVVVWRISGSATNVHSWREILPAPAERYVTGFFGLLTDGLGGIPFQTPFYAFALFALAYWKQLPRGCRTGLLAGSIYILYLLPRPEWYGGWAPPLRYVVFLMPVLALAAAAIWDRLPGGVVALAAAATGGLAVHGLVHPHHLFHIGNGENAVGEWLSSTYHGDFSRLFPSVIRLNEAARIAGVVAGVLVLAIVIAVLLRRPRPAAISTTATPLAIAIASLLLGAGFRYGLQPASHVDFEDAHVTHEGGALHPDYYTVARFQYRGGWILQHGDALSFLAQKGTWTLEAITGLGATIDVAGRTYQVTPTNDYQRLRIVIPQTGRVTLRCLTGAVNLDRMSRDE